MEKIEDKNQAEAELEKVIKFIEEEDLSTYEIIEEKEDRKLYRKYDEKTGVAKLRATVNFDIPTEIIWKMITEMKLRTQWDKTFKDLEILEKLGENLDIVYYMIKAPIGIRNRTFVCKRAQNTTQFKGFDYILQMESVEHEKKPPQKRYVRGVVFANGYLFKKIDGGKKTLAELYLHGDIKGMIPKLVVNPFVAKTVKKWIQSIIDGYGKLKSKGEFSA